MIRKWLVQLLDLFRCLKANLKELYEDNAEYLSLFLVLDHAENDAKFLAKVDLGIVRSGTGDVEIMSSFERTEKELKTKPGVEVPGLIRRDEFFGPKSAWLSDDSITLVCDVSD